MQVTHLSLVERGLKAKIELLNGLNRGQTGEFEARHEAALASYGRFLGEHPVVVPAPMCFGRPLPGLAPCVIDVGTAVSVSPVRDRLEIFIKHAVRNAENRRRPGHSGIATSPRPSKRQTSRPFCASSPAQSRRGPSQRKHPTRSSEHAGRASISLPRKH